MNMHFSNLDQFLIFNQTKGLTLCITLVNLITHLLLDLNYYLYLIKHLYFEVKFPVLCRNIQLLLYFDHIILEQILKLLNKLKPQFSKV